MIKTTRRQALAGALAMPTAARLPACRQAAGDAVQVYDRSFDAGRRFARSAPDAVAIEGDRIRFARAIFARRPSLVIGVSRHADALLIAEVGHEAGYRPVAVPAGVGQSGWALAPRI